MALIITAQNKDGLGVVEAYMIVATAAAVKGFQMDSDGLNPVTAVKYKAELAIYKDQATRMVYGNMPIMRETMEFTHAPGEYIVDEAYNYIKLNGIPRWSIISVRTFQ